MTSPRNLLSRLRSLTASTTAGGVMLVGLPLALDYVVRPGDTLSEIAGRHGTSVSALVRRNGLHPSADRIVAGETLTVPGSRSRQAPRRAARTAARPGPDARRIVAYTVRPGDTPSGLAVRFHAWTAELIAMNGPVLRVGERIRIPVVLAALAGARRTPEGRQIAQRSRARSAPPPRAGHPSRAAVRRVVETTARRHGVPPALALAVAWQESGWQMDRVSEANAIGAMQVLPATGRWMSGLAGRRLHLRDTQDNATAGVLLLDLLRDQATLRVAVAGYYQGLAGVRRHGMYQDTRRYVAGVLALKRRIARGEDPT